MSEKRRGLGRGLGALIPTGSSTGAERPVDVFFPGRPADRDASSGTPSADGDGADTGSGDVTDSTTPSLEADPVASGSDTELLPVPGVHFAELPVDQIAPNSKQPRSVFDEEALAELTGSIKEIGVLQPVVVRPSAEPGGPPYELIMGERRWRASQAAGLTTVPAIVRETDDADLLRDALLENLHRSQLNPLEEAAAYQQLLDDFGCTQEELARRIHRSRPQVSNTLRLLRLPPAVQRRVAAGVLSAGHARALLGLPDEESMDRLATRIVAEGLSVRATEEAVTMWEGAPAAKRPRAPRAGDRIEALDDLASRLADSLDTRVKVQLGKSRGKVLIEFASVQDLNRIIAILRPEDPGVLR